MNFWEELRVAYYDMVELKVSLGYNEGTYRTSHILPFVEYCSPSISQCPGDYKGNAG